MRAPTLWIAAAAGLAGAAAGGVGVGLLRDPAPAQPAVQAQVEALSAELATLRDELEVARQSSRELADAVAELRAAPAPVGAAPADAAPQAAPASRDAAAERSGDWFDAESLRELGDAPAEIERLRELYEQSQLEILYLRDRAVREGWNKQPRFREERKQIQAALREELDAAAYDRLLYATGRPNRVILDGVFADSPAARSGLEAGDEILRYGDTAIFAPRELQQATAAGRAGATVAVDVLRDGVRRRFYLPRGPLGARLRAARRPPEARW